MRMKINDGDPGSEERHIQSFAVFPFAVDDMNAYESEMTPTTPCTFLSPAELSQLHQRSLLI
jgi:hypothetical protein